MTKFWKKKNSNKEVIEDAKIIEEVSNPDPIKPKSQAESGPKPQSEFDNIKNKAKDFAHDVGKKSKEAAHTIGEKAPEVAEAVVGKTKEMAQVVSDKAPGVADTVVEKTKRFTSTVVEKTEETVSYGKLKLRLHNQRSQLSKTFSELGGRAYDLITEKGDIPGDADIKTIAGKVTALKKDITATEKEIEAVGQSI